METRKSLRDFVSKEFENVPVTIFVVCFEAHEGESGDVRRTRTVLREGCDVEEVAEA